MDTLHCKLINSSQLPIFIGSFHSFHFIDTWSIMASKTLFPLTSSLYVLMSAGLGGYNKFILNNHNFPLFYTAWTFLLNFLMAFVLVFTVLKPKVVKSPFWVNEISFSTWLYRIFPIGVLYGFGIICSTIAIANGAYAFVVMIKTGLPTITMIFTFMSGNLQEGKITFLKVISVIIITLGQIIICYTEVDFSLIALIFSICALLSNALNLIVTEKLVASHRFVHVDKNENKSKVYPNSMAKNYHSCDIADNGDERVVLFKEIEHSASDINVGSVAITSEMIEERSEQTTDEINKTESTQSVDDVNNNKFEEGYPNETTAINLNNININNNDGTINTSRHATDKQERIHSVLALFYFTPIACIFASITFWV